MTNCAKTWLPASVFRLAVCLALAAGTLTGALAHPAYADDHDRRGNQHARNDRRNDEHYRQPIYYTAPPVVYASPGPSINLNFPLYR